MGLSADSYLVLNAARIQTPLIQKDAIRPPGRSEARAIAMLMIAGAGLVAMSLLLPHPSGGHEIALVATAVGMALTGLLVWFLSSWLPPAASHVLLAAVVLVTGVLFWESGLAVGQYGTIFTWATLISAYFYSRRAAAFHLAWLLLVYAGSLAVVENTGGYSPVTRWLFSAVSLTVVMLFVSNLVARRCTPTSAPAASSTSPRTCSRRWTCTGARSRSTPPGSGASATAPRRCAVGRCST